MKRINFIILAIFISIFCFSCQKSEVNKVEMLSPSGNVKAGFNLNGNGEMEYKLTYNNEQIINNSKLGFHFKEGELTSKFVINKIEKTTFHEEWELPWGEDRYVENRYNETKIFLQTSQLESIIYLNIIYRVFDDGIGFRYEFPLQKNIDSIIIEDELTEFNLSDDYKCWWQPADWDSYEHLYNSTNISGIDALNLGDPGLNESNIKENAVHTPFTMKTQKGKYLSIHEANLTDYASMTIKVDTENYKLMSSLVKSDITGYAVSRKLPFETPWRTIQLAQKAGDLIHSKLILNLNEPNKLGDVSWIKPMKYCGIWWEMHLDKSAWDMESGNHGATTANAKRYIDFASSNNLGGVLVEGWNTGWDRWTGIPDREGVFDFVTPYADYDLKEVVDYAKKKNVEIIMHHETSAAPRTYEKQLDAAYTLMNDLGVSNAKLGYVGRIIPDGEHHHTQWMVNHYRKVLETAAKYKIAINVHEPIKPTGLRRTYPNLVSAEGLRGQEFNAWASDGGNPPNHLTIVPFTRMLAGPIDYTPGIFNMKLEPYKANNQVNTTLAQQLAIYVVIYSPVQMVADLPEHYEGNPAMQFIRDVAVDWQKSIVLDGEIGEYVAIARKDRNSENWFLGALTNETAREIEIDFDFLDDMSEYELTIYKDGKNAHWDNNPTDLDIEKMKIDKTTLLSISMASGGGVAMSIIKK